MGECKNWGKKPISSDFDVLDAGVWLPGGAGFELGIFGIVNSAPCGDPWSYTLQLL